MTKLYRRKLKILSAVILMSLVVKAQGKRPNIILIMVDDMGYSDLGCYGGEIDTPNIDQLAQEGLRYKQFYNAARCCPTRAALMTGIYPHQAGMGWMTVADMGTPEYQGDLNENCVTIAEVLKSANYKTYMTGKWHLTNDRKVSGEVIDNWPKQRGFDRYFGILPGTENYFTPTLYSNNTSYTAPDDFYITKAISDTSATYIKDHVLKNPKNPFFMYVAYTAPHFPLHALENEINKYKITYNVGWDSIRKSRFEKQKEIGLFSNETSINPRDPEVPAWEQISEDERNEFIMRMAIYAAQVDIMDQGIGHITQTLKKYNQLENTLIFFLSDNGATAEYISNGESKKVDGSANTRESYRINWANVSSTPYKEYKHYTYEGGIATPLIIHWPETINSERMGTFTNDYGHIMDIMATCVEVSGANYPKRFGNNEILPLQGKSLLPVIEGKTRDRGKIFWEHEANIAMRDGNWKMVAKTEPDEQFSMSTLHLYNLESDPTETKDLSLQYPEQLKNMYQQWLEWGKSINVFPLNTLGYGPRRSLYRRNINGQFDMNLGGWEIAKSESIEADIVTDHANQISGANAAKIQVYNAGNKPKDLSMSWSYPAKTGEKLSVEFKSKSDKPSKLSFGLKKVNSANPVLISNDVLVDKEVGEFLLPTITIPEDGNYELYFYMGDIKDNSTLWIDAVNIKTSYN
ncbi:arylsulfatase [Arenibacter sp. ARW7G5Y1]|uniref:arylsulfatase n=1 Tax=Arenibacter sp. ARW7G5Y1 TaxID=2135619 RepID=UPI000D758110|nr:arylsulfatase [Arenibacter sp. ARW7G5Y1]PXX21459.1 arylsulfatase [Arenibacter sp. ARW7G5Y1]